MPFYNANDEELEQWFIFCVCVAGKSAAQMEKKVDAFLGLLKDVRHPIAGATPLMKIDVMLRRRVKAMLRRVKMGRYDTLTDALVAGAKAVRRAFFLQTCSVDELIRIPGVGPKTARFFLMYTRPGFRGAILDTHILKWMDRQQGTPPIYDFPQSTPQNPRRYAEIEDMFLAVCDARNLKPSELDSQIWKSMARPQHV